jgi:hypothetical protein
LPEEERVAQRIEEVEFLATKTYSRRVAVAVEEGEDRVTVVERAREIAESSDVAIESGWKLVGDIEIQEA